MVQLPVRELAQPLLEPQGEDLRRVFSAYGISESAECRPLCRKRNLFYLVEDHKRGIRTVLRISGPRRSEEELSAEALWLCELRRDTGLLVPKPVQTGTGVFCIPFFHTMFPRASHCMVFSYLRGTPPDAETSTFTGLYQRLGEMTAQLHQNAILWNCSGRLPRPTIDCDAVGASLFEGLDRADLFTHALAAVRDRLAAFGRAPDRFGLIHADLRPANLLIEGGNVALLDFDDCGYGWFLYDFAGSVSGMETRPLLPKLMQAWLEGYRRYRKVSREEANELPTFLMLHRLLRLDKKFCAGSLSAGFLRDTAALAEHYLRTR